MNSEDYYIDPHRIRLERSTHILKKFQEYVDYEIVSAPPKSHLS